MPEAMRPKDPPICSCNTLSLAGPLPGTRGVSHLRADITPDRSSIDVVAEPGSVIHLQGSLGSALARYGPTVAAYEVHEVVDNDPDAHRNGTRIALVKLPIQRASVEEDKKTTEDTESKLPH